MAEALEKGADTLITCGAVTSNHARATAVAAARCGLRSHLVLRGARPEHVAGNLLLDTFVGADVTFIKPSQWAEREAIMAEVAASLVGEGAPRVRDPGGRLEPPRHDGLRARCARAHGAGRRDRRARGACRARVRQRRHDGGAGPRARGARPRGHRRHRRGGLRQRELLRRRHPAHPGRRRLRRLRAAGRCALAQALADPRGLQGRGLREDDPPGRSALYAEVARPRRSPPRRPSTPARRSGRSWRRRERVASRATARRCSCTTGGIFSLFGFGPEIEAVEA